MTRMRRIDPDGGWHHVMNRGVDRQPIFRDDHDRREFGRCVAAACRRLDVEVHAYCLMTNHFHLVVRCPRAGVSEMMQLACGLYAMSFNRRHGRVGHLFGDRFTSRLITTERYIANAVRYVHRNPLVLPGVERCADHRWSSHTIYLGQRPAADFVRTSTVLAWFDDVDAFARFVDGRERTDTVPAVVSAPAATVLGAVDLAIAEHTTLIGRPVRAQRRAIALDIAGRAEPELASELRSALELDDDGAWWSACARARRHLERHRATRFIIERVDDLLDGPCTVGPRAA